MTQFKQASLGERVILKPIIEKVSKGGILISTSERNQAINTNQGVVVMVGPQAWWDLPEKPDIKPGDTVYYSKYGGMVLKVEGAETFFVICNDKDLLVAFEGEAAKEEEIS